MADSWMARCLCLVLVGLLALSALVAPTAASGVPIPGKKPFGLSSLIKQAKTSDETKQAQEQARTRGVAPRPTTLLDKDSALYEDKALNTRSLKEDTIVTCNFREFQVEDEVSRGGYGIIYNLKDRTSPKSDLVLKVCSKREMDDDVLTHTGVRACVYEAEMMFKMLTQPEEKDQLPLCVGRNFMILRRLKPFDPAQRTHANTNKFKAVFHTLTEFHDLGFAHNDIKKGNIMVNADGQLVVIDYGAASPAMRNSYFTNIGNDETGRTFTPSLARDAFALVNVMKAAVRAQDAKRQAPTTEQKQVHGGGEQQQVDNKEQAVKLSTQARRVVDGLNAVNRELKVLAKAVTAADTDKVSTEEAGRLKAAVQEQMKEAFRLFWHRKSGGRKSSGDKEQQHKDKDKPQPGKQKEQQQKQQKQEKDGKQQRKSGDPSSRQQQLDSPSSPTSPIPSLGSRSPSLSPVNSPIGSGVSGGDRKQQQQMGEKDDSDAAETEEDEDQDQDEADDESDDADA